MRREKDCTFVVMNEQIFGRAMKSAKQKVMPVATPRENRRQEHRMTQISGLEQKIRKHRVIGEATKAVVQDLYSSSGSKKAGPRKSAKPKKKGDVPVIVLAPSKNRDESDSDDFNDEEDEQNFLKYNGRLHTDFASQNCSNSEGNQHTASSKITNNKQSEHGLLTPQTAESGVSSSTTVVRADDRRRSGEGADHRLSTGSLGEYELQRGRRKSVADQIFDSWHTELNKDHTLSPLSPVNYLKQPAQTERGRRTSRDTSSLPPSRGVSPIDLLNRSTEAIQSLKDGLVREGEMESPNSERRPSLYQMDKSEAEIWRHCRLLGRRRSFSANDVNVEELRKCRYLRIPGNEDDY